MEKDASLEKEALEEELLGVWRRRGKGRAGVVVTGVGGYRVDVREVEVGFSVYIVVGRARLSDTRGSIGIVEEGTGVGMIGDEVLGG